MKRPKHRIFDYTPRYYNPENDPKEKQKKKLGFSKHLKLKRKKRSPIIWILFILAVIFIILKLNKIG
jgi:cytoskeletal protein RodZ